MHLADKTEVEALFLTAGILVQHVWELTNGYWPTHADYAEIRAAQPWWLVQTDFGLVQVGWRKRVMHIEWSATSIKTIVTEDDTTKKEQYVHAWTNDKAVKYLMELKRQAATRITEIDPNTPFTEYPLPEDLVEGAVEKVTRLYGDSDEAKKLDKEKRESMVGDAVRRAMSATLHRASSDLNTKASVATGAG